MKRLALLSIAAVVVVLAALTRVDVHAALIPAFAAGPTVDARALEDTADGQTGHFLVVLREQASVRTAIAAAPDRAAQGRLAYDALRRSASASQPSVLALLNGLGVRYRAYWIVNAIAVEGDRAVLDALAARGDVKAIESNRAFRVRLETAESLAPEGPAAIEWNLSWVNAPDVWNLGYTGQGRVYANADTGVRWNHPALQPHYRGWDGATADHNYNWWDAIHSDIDGNGANPCGFDSAAPCDDHGHGTHTTGTGVGDDGLGNQIGVAPGARWIACRNMEDGVGRPSTYIECLQFFMAPTDLAGQNPDPNRRPDAVGNSYGCPPEELCSPASLLAAVQNVRDAGIFMAVSAGNSGPTCSTVTDPPSIEDPSITVGATAFQSNGIAGFSSRGPVTVDGSNRRKPDLVAPGVSVRSSLGTGYAVLNGTSMASPHVAGAVALLWSAFPHLVRDVDHTEQILLQTATPLTTTQGCGGDTPSQVPNNVYGYGQLNVLAAYNLARSELPPSSKVSQLLAYQVQVTFPISYTVSGPGSLDHVELWYRYRRSDVPRWSDWTLYGSFTSSPMEFTPPRGPGIYRFYTVAVSGGGYREAPPATFDAKTRFVPNVAAQTRFFYGTADDPTPDGPLHGAKAALWVDWATRSFQFFRMANAYAARTNVGTAMTVTGDLSAPVITIDYADNKMALTNVQIDVGTDTATGAILDKATGKTYQLGDPVGMEVPY